MGMMTVFLTVLIAMSIWTVRHATLTDLKAIWHEARWHERAALLLFIVPIPGPFDELIATAVAVRVQRRIQGQASR